MSSSDLASQLIELETADNEKAAHEAELRAQLTALTAQLEEAERERVHMRKEVVRTRRELEYQRRRDQSADEAQFIRQQQQALRTHYESIAADKLWYTGTGNDDAVLEHQMMGAMFGAVAERWILGDGIGLGKTRTMTGWLDLIDAQKIIVVCESNIASQFLGEMMTIAPHHDYFDLLKRSPATRHELMDAAMKQDHGVIVVNFEIWRRDQKLLQKMLEWQADTVIVDEAHNLNHTSTSNYKNIAVLVEYENTCASCGLFMDGLRYQVEGSKKWHDRVCERCGWSRTQPLDKFYGSPLQDWLKTRSVRYIGFTTGTPILNAPDDIYSLLHLCDPKLFPTRADFLRTYCVSNPHSGKYEFGPHGIENLKPLIANRFLARKREDAGIVLPKQRIHVIPVELDKAEYPAQHRVIRQITEAAMIELEDGRQMTMMHLISVLTRKRQANVWPGGIEFKDTDPLSPTYGEVLWSVGEEVRESVKMDVIGEHILMLHEEGRRQLAFSQFKTPLREFERRLTAEGLRVARLDGDTTTARRNEIKRNFNRSFGEAPKWDVLLCNYKAGGTGLNFTAATATHIMDEEWNPGKQDQSHGRTDRIGQTQTSDVYIYRIPKSVDTWLANLQSWKRRMVNDFDQTLRKGDDTELTTGALLASMKTGEMI